jgi:RimJ/RimL family protein N-acetyltransferase
MRIDGDGWYLRPDADPRDAAAIARAFADDPHLVVDWGVDEVPDEQQARAMLEERAAMWDEGEGRHLAVVDAGTDTYLGGVNFHRIEPGHGRAEVGFWLVPAARGRGIGNAAVAAACEWAFERWQLNRIEMTTLPDNAGALALAAKLGFTREGLLRQRNFERGHYVDIVMLSVLRGELVSAESS